MLFRQTQQQGLSSNPPGGPALWQRPAWLRAPLLALAWACLLAYGSLLPFGFDLSGAIHDAGGAGSAVWVWISSPRWVQASASSSSLGIPAWVSDLITNLLIYGPLGALLRLTWSRVTGRHLIQIVLSVFCVFMMSWLLEATQSLIPGRYASLQDVLTNTAGGAVGVMLGHQLNALWRRTAFWIYRVSLNVFTAIQVRIGGRIPSTYRHKLLVVLVVCTNVLLVGMWWCLSGPTSAETGGQVIQWVPFRAQFERSYDVAAVMLGRSLIVYCLVGALVMLPTMRGRSRRALGWVVLGTGLMAAGVEGLKLTGVGGTRSADLTELMLALIAGGLVLMLGFMVVHAARLSCRRVQARPVAFERRRRPHDYRFSLRADKASFYGDRRWGDNQGA
ncbi:MAG: hypothetical protein Kow00105_00390 [Phycisphaeraceae bacterium]